MAHSRTVVRSSLVVLLLLLTVVLAPRIVQTSHAQVTAPGDIQVTGLVEMAATTSLTTTSIVQASTAVSTTFSPNYLPACVHTGNPAFVVVNRTTSAQAITALPGQQVIATIPAGRAIGLTVSGAFPGFVLAGLVTNHRTALAVYCR